MIRFVSQQKVPVLSLVNQKRNFVLNLHYNDDVSYMFGNKSQALDNIPWYQICVGSVSKNFTKVKMKDFCWI